MTQRKFAPAALLGPALLVLALAACQQPANDTDIAIDNSVNAAEAANADIETLPPSEEGGTPAPAPATPPGNNAAAPPPDESEDDSENSPSTAIIPAQYRGRWGMNANDCTPGRSDAKGLMTIRANSIKFYESVASLQEQRPAIATSFSGVYSFMGEGQQWERVITLTRTGNMLKRAQADGTFNYTRCP